MNSLPTLINLPPFLIRDINEKNLTFFSKIKLIFIGKFLSLIINKTEKKLFCRLINSLFKKDGQIIYQNGQYIKLKDNTKIIHYPNKRILRVVKSIDYQLELILNSYCLDKVIFENQDIVIDCGANVGELNLAIEKRKDVKIKYYGFEPDAETFKSLLLNNPENSETLFELGLSNENKKMEFFLDTEGGNSSLVDFGAKNKVEIKTIKLDSLKINGKIKLIKVEAEGFEPEVLLGSENTLAHTELVSVDFGPERGIEAENTVVQVNNILTKVGFELIEFSQYRIAGLYKNILI